MSKKMNHFFDEKVKKCGIGIIILERRVKRFFLKTFLQFISREFSCFFVLKFSIFLEK